MGNRARLVAIVAALALAVAAPACGEEPSPRAPAERPRQLTLALDFTPNAGHAGIYGAIAAREDRARGLALRLRTPTASTDSLKLLASGRADLSVADIHDLGLARERGEDLVGVGAIVQRPLAAVIARPPVRRPRELEGRRVGVVGLPSDDAVLRAVLEADGGRVERVRRTTIGFSAVPALVSGRVAAATAFWNAEGVALRQRGVRTREFRIGDFAAPRYPELVLVARRRDLSDDRTRLRGAVEAIEAGTRRALSEPRPALSAVTRASAAKPADVEAQFRAVRPALSPPVRLERGSLHGWAEFAHRFGILRERPDVDDAFDLHLLSQR